MQDMDVNNFDIHGSMEAPLREKKSGWQKYIRIIIKNPEKKN